MPAFDPSKDVVTSTPTIEVTGTSSGPLAVGKHVFQLIVEDDSGNPSKPMQVEIVVLDDQAPTAILTAPPRVSFGAPFVLDGSKSTDVGGGKVVKWTWTLVQ